MSRWRMAAGAAAVALLAAACASSGGGTGTASSPITLTIWHDYLIKGLALGMGK